MRELQSRPAKVLGAIVGAVLCAALLVLANPAPAQAADASAEASFVSRINSLRTSHGLAPLQVYGELVGIGRGWSDQMAGAGSISHNPNLSSQVSAQWTKLGENVGVGSDVDTLMNAFVNSPPHYKNIMDPGFNYIGVGVSYGSDGRMFVTQDFMELDDQSVQAPDPTPPPAPKPPKTQSSSGGSSSSDGAGSTSDGTAADAAATPPSPADAARIHAVLTALRVVAG
jgi:hypothetical protein